MQRTPPPKGKTIDSLQVTEPYRDGSQPGIPMPAITYHQSTNNNPYRLHYQNQNQLPQLKATVPMQPPQPGVTMQYQPIQLPHLQPPMYYQIGQINHQQDMQYYHQATSLPFIPSQQYLPHTEWQTIRNNRKKLRSPEEQRDHKQSKLTNYWLSKPVETQNRFENLPEEPEKNTEAMEEWAPKPPPITVYSVNYIANLHEGIGKIAPEKYTLKVIGNGQVKVQLADAKYFKPVIEMLDKNKTQYHTAVFQATRAMQNIEFLAHI